MANIKYYVYGEFVLLCAWLIQLVIFGWLHSYTTNIETWWKRKKTVLFAAECISSKWNIVRMGKLFYLSLYLALILCIHAEDGDSFFAVIWFCSLYLLLFLLCLHSVHPAPFFALFALTGRTALSVCLLHFSISSICPLFLLSSFLLATFIPPVDSSPFFSFSLYFLRPSFLLFSPSLAPKLSFNHLDYISFFDSSPCCYSPEVEATKT